MADKKQALDKDAMTLILGLGGPREPGMHGRMQTPPPEEDAVTLITNIRDMCEEWLMGAGKNENEAGNDEETPEEGEEMEEE